MHLSLLLTLAGLAMGDNVGGIHIEFDPSLEGRIGIAKQVEESVGELFVEAEYSTPKSGAAIENAIDARSLISRNPMLDMRAMDKRQYTCDPGYGYCEGLGGCCLTTQLCCSYGYCLDSGDRCCPNGPCDPGTLCCGQNHCYPEGGECCSDESHCKPGNHCYIIPSQNNARRCCTDSRCTAVVLDNGSTSYAATTTTTRTYTTTSTQVYYWTVTWWYWYYFWTYSIEIEASIVTSTRSTTSSTLTVRTTDSAAATDYFNSLSSELELPTPEAAITLESLAGQTSFDDPPETSTTEREEPEEPEETSTTSTTEDEPEETSTTSEEAFEETTSDDTKETRASGVLTEEETVTQLTLPTDTLGDDGAGASSLLHAGINGWAVSLVAMGVGTGVLAFLL